MENTQKSNLGCHQSRGGGSNPSHSIPFLLQHPGKGLSRSLGALGMSGWAPGICWNLGMEAILGIRDTFHDPRVLQTPPLNTSKDLGNIHSFSGNSSPSSPHPLYQPGIPSPKQGIGFPDSRAGTFRGLGQEYPKSTFSSGPELLAGWSRRDPSFFWNVWNARSTPDGNQAPSEPARCSGPKGFMEKTIPGIFSSLSAAQIHREWLCSRKSWSRDFFPVSGVPRSCRHSQKSLPNPAP